MPGIRVLRDPSSGGSCFPLLARACSAPLIFQLPGVETVLAPVSFPESVACYLPPDLHPIFRERAIPSDVPRELRGGVPTIFFPLDSVAICLRLHGATLCQKLRVSGGEPAGGVHPLGRPGVCADEVFRAMVCLPVAGGHGVEAETRLRYFCIILTRRRSSRGRDLISALVRAGAAAQAACRAARAARAARRAWRAGSMAAAASSFRRARTSGRALYSRCRARMWARWRR